jgi:hypothetical protein
MQRDQLSSAPVMAALQSKQSAEKRECIIAPSLSATVADEHDDDDRGW